jgi:hypothetical protein
MTTEQPLPNIKIPHIEDRSNKEMFVQETEVPSFAVRELDKRDCHTVSCFRIHPSYYICALFASLVDIIVHFFWTRSRAETYVTLEVINTCLHLYYPCFRFHPRFSTVFPNASFLFLFSLKKWQCDKKRKFS